MEYRNTQKTKSETTNSACSTTVFMAVLNMFTFSESDVFKKSTIILLENNMIIVRGNFIGQFLE